MNAVAPKANANWPAALARDRFGPRAEQELSRVLDESPGAAEVPGIVKLIFECETAEEFLRRVREA